MSRLGPGAETPLAQRPEEVGDVPLLELQETAPPGFRERRELEEVVLVRDERVLAEASLDPQVVEPGPQGPSGHGRPRRRSRSARHSASASPTPSARVRKP